MHRSILLSILITAAISLPALARTVLTGQSAGMAFKVEQVAKGLDVPWGMVFLGPSELLFTEQLGRVSIIDPRDGDITPLSGIPGIRAQDQGGLLDVAVAPAYKPGDWIYFTYSKEVRGRGATTLARARREGNRLEAWQDLLVTRSATNTDKHYGSRMAFGHAGHLFFTVGERGMRPNAQDLTNHAGSVLRVRLDGTAPKDNPFINTADALPEIFSYGHRNPQGIVFDPARNRLWAIEHGPRGGDEINLILPGRNYGWPVISHGKEYWGPMPVGEGTHKPGMEPPVKVYIPSIAPGSLILCSGKAFPAWKGNLMAGALKLRHLNRIVLNESGSAVKEERLIEELDERIRAVIESPEGWIYFSTDSGGIYRIRPATVN